MHIAICFWGICRSTDITIESIKRCLYEPLTKAGHTYHVYIHTFSLSTKLNNPRSAEHNITLNNTLYQVLEPTRVLVEEQNSVDSTLNAPLYQTQTDPWFNNYITHTNHVRALYSLMQVTSMWSETVYDRVIYARPDVQFHNPLNLEWLNVDKNTIVLPNFHGHPINDRFALGSPNVMKIYGSRFKQALDYSKINPLHSETYLAYILESHNIVINPVLFNFCRIRADKQPCPGDPQS